MDELDHSNISVTVKTYNKPGGVATAMFEYFPEEDDKNADLESEKIGQIKSAV